MADQLSFAFESPTGVPYGTVGLRSHNKFNPPWTMGSSTIAEVATLQLEWEYLARHTGRSKYAELARRPMEVLHGVQPADGLFPMWINPDTGAASLAPPGLQAAAALGSSCALWS